MIITAPEWDVGDLRRRMCLEINNTDINNWAATIITHWSSREQRPNVCFHGISEERGYPLLKTSGRGIQEFVVDAVTRRKILLGFQKL